jgi:hypothetical protein
MYIHNNNNLYHQKNEYKNYNQLIVRLYLNVLIYNFNLRNYHQCKYQLHGLYKIGCQCKKIIKICLNFKEINKNKDKKLIEKLYVNHHKE